MFLLGLSVKFLSFPRNKCSSSTWTRNETQIYPRNYIVSTRFQQLLENGVLLSRFQTSSKYIKLRFTLKNLKIDPVLPLSKSLVKAWRCRMYARGKTYRARLLVIVTTEREKETLHAHTLDRVTILNCGQDNCT